MASCPDCLRGNIVPGEPTGQMVKVGAVDAYFAPGPSETRNPDRAVVLLTDVFGLPLVNCKIMADKFAKDIGCDVWVPDLFNGSPLIATEELSMPYRPGQKRPFLEVFWLILKMLTRIPKVLSIRSSVVDPRVISFIGKIREDKSYKKIGAVGYCFGGGLAVRLGATDAVDSIVIVHPGGLSLKQVQAIKIPNSWGCAEEDEAFKKPFQRECEAEFKQREGKDNYVDYEFVEYKNTTHGFGSRPNLEHPDLVEAFENCMKQTSDWFKKTL